MRQAAVICCNNSVPVIGGIVIPRRAVWSYGQGYVGLADDARITRADNMVILLEHDSDRQLASIADGTARLYWACDGLRIEFAPSDNPLGQDTLHRVELSLAMRENYYCLPGEASSTHLRGWSPGWRVTRNEYREIESAHIEEISIGAFPGRMGTTLKVNWRSAAEWQSQVATTMETVK